MSTLNYNKKQLTDIPPPWTCRIDEFEYHRAAKKGEVVSSSLLKEFRRCPAHYHAIVSGYEEPRAADAYRFGRAAHKYILEGEEAFRKSFAVGGPRNERTGRAYSHDSKAFGEWLDECGIRPESALTTTELGSLARMRTAVLTHREVADLFRFGWAELTARAELRGLECQARFDWLCGDGVMVDLKTTSDISRFEADARRYGYLNQFAFYREVARSAGADACRLVAVVVEKRLPYRVGVWKFPDATLDPYAAENAAALASLRRCRETRSWPTGYEGTRAFPPAGMPAVWFN
jgi:hypothetical protein